MPKRLQVEFGPITPSNIDQLKKIHAGSFPVSYHDLFYQDLLKTGNPQLNKFAYFKGVVVGAICSRIELVDGESHRRLYIMTLAVSPAYRGKSIGTQLLRSVLTYCKDIDGMKEARLHVHVSNEDAVRFYTTRFGFTKGDLVENYYKRIKPPHCFLLCKTFEPS